MQRGPCKSRVTVTSPHAEFVSLLAILVDIVRRDANVRPRCSLLLLG